MVHDRRQPFARQDRFEGQAQRGNLDAQGVVRHRPGRRVAIVREVREQDRELPLGLVLEECGEEGVRVPECLRRIGRQIVFRRGDVDQAQVAALERRKLRKRRRGQGPDGECHDDEDPRRAERQALPGLERFRERGV